MEWVAHHGISTRVSEDNRRNRGDDHQQPHHGKHPQRGPQAGDGADAQRPQDSHQPVEAHQHDDVDGGVHVGQTQVEEDLAHRCLEHPSLHSQVDDEERGEGHQRAVCDGQVEDEQSGDRLLSGASQDAPDDKEVSGEAQEEDEAQDDGAHVGGVFARHDAAVLLVGGPRAVPTVV